MQARELMKTHVVKTMPQATLAEAVDLMDLYQVNSMPVIDADGRLCGIVAEQDIFAAARLLIMNAAADGPSPGDEDLASSTASIPVAKVMRRPVLSVSEDSDVREAARLFLVNDFTRLPVLSADGDVVGTINRVDILQGAFEGVLPAAGD